MASVMKGCGSAEGYLFGFGASLRTDFSVPFNILDVRGSEVEEDDGSPKLRSIWQQMQINRKANMVLLSRVFLARKIEESL